jgi:hypothetical protein
MAIGRRDKWETANLADADQNLIIEWTAQL